MRLPFNQPRVAAGLFTLGLSALGLGIALIAQPGNGLWGNIGWIVTSAGSFCVLAAVLLWEPFVSRRFGPKLVVEPSFARAGTTQGELLSVQVHNEAKSGQTARGVVPTLEARFEDRISPDDPPRPEMLEHWRNRPVRGHGLWMNDPFGTHSHIGLDTRVARRRDFPPTGERERLGIAIKESGDDTAYLLDSSLNKPVEGAIYRGRWRVELSLRGDDLPRPLSIDLHLVNYGSGGPLRAEIIEEVRRFGIGPKRIRVLASTAVRFKDKKQKWWKRQS